MSPRPRPALAAVLSCISMPSLAAQTKVPPKHTSTIGMTAIEPGGPGDFAWQPEASTEGPVTILVTEEDRRIRLFRGGVQIGWSIYSLADPTRKLSFHVLTLLEDPAKDPGEVWSNGPTRRWMIVSGAPQEST